MKTEENVWKKIDPKKTNTNDVHLHHMISSILFCWHTATILASKNLSFNNLQPWPYINNVFQNMHSGASLVPMLINFTKGRGKYPPGGKGSRLRQRMLWVPAGLVEPHPQQEWSQHPIIHIWLRSNAFSCVGNNPQHPLIRWTSLHTCTHTSLCSNQSRSWPTL